MKRLSLRSRLLLITLALLLIGLATGATIVTSLLENHLRTRLDSELRSVGQLLQLSDGPTNQDRPGADSQALALGLDLFGSPYFVFLDPGGKVVSQVSSPRIARDQLPRWKNCAGPSPTARPSSYSRPTGRAGGVRSRCRGSPARWWWPARSPRPTRLSPAYGAAA